MAFSMLDYDIWSGSISVSISHCHCEETGSIPVRTAKFFRSCMKVSHKDIIGNELKPDAVVVYTDNNRIVLGRIAKIHEGSTKVSVIPLQSDTKGRRPPPKVKTVRREDYNVFVVNDGEVLMGTLKGYAHDTGRWTYDPDADPYEDN